MSTAETFSCLALVAMTIASPVPSVQLSTSVMPVDPLAVPFALSDVKLADGSLFALAQKRNQEFQLSLNNTQLLCEFTAAANLTKCEKPGGAKCATNGTDGMPVCNPLAGQMGPGGYYGHYLGHYLSGTAMMYNNTQDPIVKAKADDIVAGLAEVQHAWGLHGAVGYIFPNYPGVFGIMEGRCGMERQSFDYSVPYYTLHKVMAGLLDQATLAGNEQAMSMVVLMADWVVMRVQETFSAGGQTLWQCVLNTEWGGMNEVMYNIYAITGTESHLKTGHLFNHFQWTAPLAIGEDDLDASHGNKGGNHANTHIPEIIGSARGYELTGNLTQKSITTNFFDIVTTNHSWATGGSNDGEHWQAPMRMGDQLNGDTEESCTQYNMLKVARHLFKWTADSKFFDYFERAIMNGMLGNQNHLDSEMTSFIYMLPLGSGGMSKPWGKSNVSFPCCWGTLTEQFSKLSDSIYFASPDQQVVFVNQFVSSSVQWAAQGIVLTQNSGFPTSPDSTTMISFSGDTDLFTGEFTVKIRIPAWADGMNLITINGVAVEAVVPGEYLTLKRTWAVSDTIHCHFPMSFWASNVVDNRTEFNATMAWMYGPLVLAGLTTTDVFVPAGTASKPSTFFTRNSSTELSFVAKVDPAQGTDDIAFIPLYKIMEEKYSVYFKTRGYSPVKYSPSGATVPSNLTDWTLSGASISASLLKDHTDLRTDGPGVVSDLTIAHPIESQGHVLDSVSFSYQYVAGYDKTNGTWPMLSAMFVDAQTGGLVKTVYTSQPLDKYFFDHYNGYSPMTTIVKTDLNIANNGPLFFRIVVKNNDHNLQIPLDSSVGLNVTLKWKPSPKTFSHAQFFHADF